MECWADSVIVPWADVWAISPGAVLLLPPPPLQCAPQRIAGLFPSAPSQSSSAPAPRGPSPWVPVGRGHRRRPLSLTPGCGGPPALPHGLVLQAVRVCPFRAFAPPPWAPSCPCAKALLERGGRPPRPPRLLLQLFPKARPQPQYHPHPRSQPPVTAPQPILQRAPTAL